MAVGAVARAAADAVARAAAAARAGTAAAVAADAAATTAAAAAPGRGDVEQHGRDGSFRSSVRIIGLEALEDAVRGNEKAQEGENAGNGGSSSEDLASKN